MKGRPDSVVMRDLVNGKKYRVQEAFILASAFFMVIQTFLYQGTDKIGKIECR